MTAQANQPVRSDTVIRNELEPTIKWALCGVYIYICKYMQSTILFDMYLIFLNAPIDITFIGRHVNQPHQRPFQESIDWRYLAYVRAV